MNSELNASDGSLAADDGSRHPEKADNNLLSQTISVQVQSNSSAIVVDGGVSVNSLETNNNGNEISQEQEKVSYAVAVKRRGLPTFLQTIVTDAIEGVTNDTYMDSFEKVMDIRNLMYFSKISENRVCFTLRSEEAASKLLGKSITIQGQALEFRAFVPGQVNAQKYKRIVISNILPQIPNDIVIEQLASLGIRTRNGITNIRCSTSVDLRKHVQSHRRQFYVKEEEASKIPAKIKVRYLNTPFWIFLGTDDIKCHFCKNTGHIAKYCPELSSTQEYSQQSQAGVEGATSERENDDHNVTANNSYPALCKENSTDLDESHKPLPFNDSGTAVQLKLKRPAPPPSSSSGSVTDTIDFKSVPFGNRVPTDRKEDHTRRSSAKKVKPSVEKTQMISESEVSDSDSNVDWFEMDTVTDDLNNVKVLYQKPDVVAPMDFDNLVTYYKGAKNKRNIVEFTENFTTDVPGLITFLEMAQNLLSDLNNRNRFKSLAKRLKKAVDSGIWPSKAPAVD